MQQYGDMFKKIRYFDGLSIKKTYTSEMSDDDLIQKIKVCISYSKLLQEQSKKFHIDFFETNMDREKVLNSIVNSIQNDYER